MNKRKQAIASWLWLIPAMLLLLPGESGAHVDLNPFNLSHNSPSHLVSTVGLQACLDAVNTVRNINSDIADNIGLTAQGCRDAASSMSQTAREAEQVVQDRAQDVLDCASDPVGCAEKIAADLGVDDPNLGKMAILTGNVSFETGGLLFSDFGITNVNITDIDDSKVSAACKAFIALPWSRGGALTLTTGGSYRLVVPACGPITYTLKPSNPLFTWNPPTRTVTVGAGNTVSSSGENSEAETLQQQQIETTYEFNGQLTQEQQSTGKSGNSDVQEQNQQQQGNQEGNRSQQNLRIEHKK